MIFGTTPEVRPKNNEKDIAALQMILRIGTHLPNASSDAIGIEPTR